ncbi:hypothetical protein LXL04_001779 [Taraxacum kok-saghyz]
MVRSESQVGDGELIFAEDSGIHWELAEREEGALSLSIRIPKIEFWAAGGPQRRCRVNRPNVEMAWGWPSGAFMIRNTMGRIRVWVLGLMKWRIKDSGLSIGISADFRIPMNRVGQRMQRSRINFFVYGSQRLYSSTPGVGGVIAEQKSIKPPAWPCRQTLPLAKFTAGATTPPPTPALRLKALISFFPPPLISSSFSLSPSIDGNGYSCGTYLVEIAAAEGSGIKEFRRGGTDLTGTR